MHYLGSNIDNAVALGLTGCWDSVLFRFMRSKSYHSINAAIKLIFLILILAGKAFPINFDPHSMTGQSDVNITHSLIRPLFLVADVSKYQIMMSDSVDTKDFYFKKKSPWVAFGLALGPGIVVHGLGHYYAGHKKAAWILFGTEIAAGVLMIWDYNRWQKNGPHITDAPLLGVYAGCYLYASWLYDVMGAPCKIDMENKKH